MTAVDDFLLLTPKDVVEEYCAQGDFARFPMGAEAQLLARVGELLPHHVDYLIGAYLHLKSSPPLEIVEQLLRSPRNETRMGALQILRGFPYPGLPQAIVQLLDGLRVSASVQIQYISEIRQKYARPTGG